MFNIISAGSLALMFLFSFLLSKTEREGLILRMFSVVLLAYKSMQYIVNNIKGHIAIPVEISTVTYFLMFIVLIFNVRSLYNVSSFFGILAGVGYYMYYIICGSMLTSLTLKSLITACIYHGFILIAVIYLFREYRFDQRDNHKIWTTILAMLCWAMLFYDINNVGTRFVYFITKPTFLYVFSNMQLNVLLSLVYYTLIVVTFHFLIKLFIYVNNHQKKFRPAVTPDDTPDTAVV